MIGVVVSIKISVISVEKLSIIVDEVSITRRSCCGLLWYWVTYLVISLKMLVSVSTSSTVINWRKFVVSLSFVGLNDIVSNLSISNSVLILISVLVVVYKDVFVNDILGKVV